MINELASRGRRGPQRHARSVPERRPLILRLLFCLFFFMISFQKCFHGVKTFRVENAFLSSLFGISLSDSNGAGNLAGEGPPTPPSLLCGVPRDSSFCAASAHRRRPSHVQGDTLGSPRVAARPQWVLGITSFGKTSAGWCHLWMTACPSPTSLTQAHEFK